MLIEFSSVNLTIAYHPTLSFVLLFCLSKTVLGLELHYSLPPWIPSPSPLTRESPFHPSYHHSILVATSDGVLRHHSPKTRCFDSRLSTFEKVVVYLLSTMDFILSLADDYVLDKAWAWAFPALPRSLSGVEPSSASYTNARLRGASSKVASPSSSAISNLTASIASALSGRSSSAAASASENAVAQQVMDASADWQSLKGVSAFSRDSFLR